MKTSKLILLSLLTLGLCSCSYDSVSDLIDASGEPVDPNVLVTYTDNISQIMQSACIGCHSSPPVNGAPFALVNFSQVNQRAGDILNAMSRQSGTPNAMPPSGRLPQATIDLVERWINDGQLEH
jgi:hypothetical protein